MTDKIKGSKPGRNNKTGKFVPKYSDPAMAASSREANLRAQKILNDKLERANAGPSQRTKRRAKRGKK